MYQAYVEGYLTEAQERLQSPNLKDLLLFGMQYQPWAHLSQEEKERQAETAIQALAALFPY